jgi:hypothetical protein
MHARPPLHTSVLRCRASAQVRGRVGRMLATHVMMLAADYQAALGR